MTGTTPAPRRSGRERKPVESVYSDAKKVVAAASSAKKKAVSRGGGKRSVTVCCIFCALVTCHESMRCVCKLGCIVKIWLLVGTW